MIQFFDMNFWKWIKLEYEKKILFQYILEIYIFIKEIWFHKNLKNFFGSNHKKKLYSIIKIVLNKNKYISIYYDS